MYDKEQPALADRAGKPSQLPLPSGHKLLIILPDVEEKTEGGIYRPEATIHAEEVASILGFVLALGPDAYQDKARFPTGPWCKVGDMVIFRPYSGTRMTVHGKELRIINDDTVDGVVDDPRGFRRA